MSLALLFRAGGGAAVATPPADDDADTAATAVLDRDAATIRPPRVTVRHALDSAKNSALTGADRLPLDRHEGISDRTGRLPNAGLFPRIDLFTGRAGEVFAPFAILIDYKLAPFEQRTAAADTATGTDRDGASMAVPTWTLRHAMDSAKNADLAQGSADQDAYATIHEPSPTASRGVILRLSLETDGRAGTPGAPFSLAVDWAPSGETTDRAASV